ncbi:ankyrin repeat domain-containing protein [Streptomyces sp. NPDC001732]
MSDLANRALFAAVTPTPGADATRRAAEVRALTADGADLSARDEEGATPLHRAVGAPYDGSEPLSSLEVVRALLECGADVHAVDGRGRTPLHSAVGCGRPRLVELLLERHADTGAVDRLGRTPLGIALRLQQLGREQRRTRAEIVALLEAAGAPAHVEYPAVEGGPLPVDMAAVRRVAEAMRGTLSEACRTAGVPDDSGWLTEFARPDFDSFQELVTELRDASGPDHVPLIPRLCARVLGDEARTDRTLTGDRKIHEPFFHHGDLLVKGHLDVVAPFVVTGSLTVEGCLADCGPDSVVAVGGDVTARAVHTDGEMSVDGDIEAEVVYGHYNDQTLRAGTIRARLVVEDEHETIATVEADAYFDLDDFQQGYGEGVQERLRELLVDEVFGNEEEEEEEEQLDRTLLFDRLRAGKPVFRADGGAAEG